jgi:hypothetical protein
LQTYLREFEYRHNLRRTPYLMFDCLLAGFSEGSGWVAIACKPGDQIVCRESERAFNNRVRPTELPCDPSYSDGEKGCGSDKSDEDQMPRFQRPLSGDEALQVPLLDMMPARDCRYSRRNAGER